MTIETLEEANKARDNANRANSFASIIKGQRYAMKVLCGLSIDDKNIMIRTIADKDVLDDGTRRVLIPGLHEFIAKKHEEIAEFVRAAGQRYDEQFKSL